MGAGSELFYEKPLNIVRGSGVWMYDGAGRAYLDVYNNVPHVGHTHPTVVRAIQQQTAILATHTRYLHSRILEYAERLTATFPPHLNACMFVNSGSEANDVAWRIAQFATRHKGGAGHAERLSRHYRCRGGAHPEHRPASRSARGHSGTAARRPRRRGRPWRSGQIDAARRDAESAIRTLASAALPLPHSFSIRRSPAPAFSIRPRRGRPRWKRASARPADSSSPTKCSTASAGRDRISGDSSGAASTPDIVTMGKPVANGYPMGVVVANRAMIEAFQKEYGFFSTFGGNPVAAAAGLAVLEVLEREKLTANALATGEYLRERLSRVAGEARLPRRGARHGSACSASRSEPSGRIPRGSARSASSTSSHRRRAC